MTDVLDGLLGLASPWSYVLVAVFAGLESAAFVGLVIPGETVMVLGGVLAFTGQASLPTMVACAAVGAVVGDSAGYELGRRFGGPLRRSRLGGCISASRWDRAEQYVRRRGGRGVLFGRFVGVLRALVPFVAGAARMPYRTFLPYNALGALIWAPGFVCLGYLAGQSYHRAQRLAGDAGLLLTVLVALLVTVALVARWVIRHPQLVLAPVSRLRARPAVERLERRYALQLRFLADRLRPGSPAGLTLTIGLGVFAGLAMTLSVVTEDVVAGDELVRVDSPVLDYLVAHREPWLTSTMAVITHLGSATVLIPVLLAVGLTAHHVRRTWVPMAFLAVTLGGAVVTSTAIKLLVARPRPSSGALVRALGYAFPSGHSTAATAGWFATAVVLGWLAQNLTVRVSVLAGALVVAVLVGVSRVYLGVHAPTDVLAGWTVGGLWVTGALTVTHLLTAPKAPVGCPGRASPAAAR